MNNICKYLYENNFIVKKDDKVIQIIDNFEKLTSYNIKSIEFNLYQTIKCLSDYDKECAPMIIKYLHPWKFKMGHL